LLNAFRNLHVFLYTLRLLKAFAPTLKMKRFGYINAPLFRLLLKPTTSNGLKSHSQIMIDKLMAIKCERITKKIGALSRQNVERLEEALILWLELQTLLREVLLGIA
jgi:hypothetical protein